MRILGLSAHYHDSAAALLVDGRVVAAAQEERFSRKKHDPAFPARAAAYCLAHAGLEPDALDAIAWYEKPFRKFDRIVSGFLDEAPRGFGRFLEAAPAWLSRRLWVRSEIERELDTSAPVVFTLHHESHAAAAYGPSPFDAAAVLTIDGVGEWTTNALWAAEGSRLEAVAELRYPDSLGLLYSAFTSYCGFRVNDGEYKLMGLAPYGEPRYAARILEHVVSIRPDGSYALAPDLFAYRHSDAMTSSRFHALFGGPPRRPGDPLTRREADLARSIQAVTEEILLRQARWARRRLGAKALCLGGGVALNCVANGRLAAERVFDHLWIQPAAGDAGGALGAAYAAWFRLARPRRAPRASDAQEGSLLGPAYDDDEIRAVLDASGCRYRRLEREALLDETAAALSRGEVVGWFQGRMEYGPRALGDRSILADPRDPGMQRRVNVAVKFREGFRPFAPVVREGAAAAWFALAAPSPYMLLTAPVRGATPSPDPALALERGFASSGPIPAVTHVDGSARVQTLAPGANPLLEALLDRFETRTGCPVLLNTSFNVKDEPIVCTPEDAYRCFCRAGLDRLVLGSYVVEARDRVPVPPASASAPAAADRRRAAIELGVAAMAAVAIAALGGQLRRWLPLLGVAAALAGVRALFPVARRRLDALLGVAGRALAKLLGLPALALVFVALVAPAGLLSRARRRPAPARESYWAEPQDRDHDLAQPH